MPPSTANQNNDPTRLPAKRTHTWLQEQLQTIWDTHFPDVERLNTITIEWGRTNRTRLGSITGRGGHRDRPERSEIRVNTLLRNPDVPESVVWQTIAHELAHYTHGFCSPHPQKYPHPHRGGVIEKELLSRNLHAVYNESEAWLKANWASYVTTNMQNKPRNTSKRSTNGSVSLLSHLKKRLTR